MCICPPTGRLHSHRFEGFASECFTGFVVVVWFFCFGTCLCVSIALLAPSWFLFKLLSVLWFVWGLPPLSSCAFLGGLRVHGVRELCLAV